MNKRLCLLLVIILFLSALGISSTMPASANVKDVSQSYARQSYKDVVYCTKCGKDIHALDSLGNKVSTESQLAKALGLTLCLQCWEDVLYGSDKSDPLSGIALLGEDGKVLAGMLPAGQGGTAWGDITGTLSSQTDLNGALNGKEPTISSGTIEQYWRGDKTWQTLPVSSHDRQHAITSTSDHTSTVQQGYLLKADANGLPIQATNTDGQVSGAVTAAHSHANLTTLDAIQEAFTTALKTSYDWLVTNITSAWKTTVDNHVASQHAPSDAQKNSDITKAEIEAKLTGEISSHSHAGGGGESEVVVIKSGDTGNSTTILANAVDLTFSASANSTYVIECFLLWDSSATTVGIKVSATASGSPTINAGHFITDAANGTPDSSSWNANDVTVTTGASAFTTYNMGKVNAMLKTSGSASTWQLRFAAETTGTITAKAGSVLRYRKVS